MNTASSAEVVGLAKELAEFACRLEAGWTMAYFRFSFEPTRLGSVVSYAARGNVLLIDPRRNADFFSSMNARGEQLFQLLNKDKGIILVSVNRELDFDVKFEFDDLGRWKISKLNGGTGLPEGV